MANGTRAPGAWFPKTSARTYAEETTCTAFVSPESAEPKRTRVSSRMKSEPCMSSTDPPPARARDATARRGVTLATLGAPRNSSCAAAFRFAAYTNGARVDFAISGVESGPPSKPATGASADTAAKPRRGVAKNDGAAAAAPPGPVAKKRGEASAAKTSAPPTAPPRLGVVRRASAPSVSDKATTLGTTPSLVGVNGVTTSNANPFDGARACVSESERRAPTGTFDDGLRAGAANVASDALEGASATGATVPYVAASASSEDTARSLCPASVTRAPPCSLTATGETSRMVGGGVATSVAAEEPRALPNASAPASATRVACAPAGSAMGVSQIASADETATATGKDAANGAAVAPEAIAHTTTPEPPSRRRSAPETNTVAPPPACAAVGATARARGGATNSKEICALPDAGSETSETVDVFAARKKCSGKNPSMNGSDAGKHSA
mmetsp:Transcript_7471/g.31829  ORF Transcript_7471/g.31829 Transcript_7471/m.31829 type:complete len:443 (-) Transcript_7471:3527-4855(-)